MPPLRLTAGKVSPAGPQARSSVTFATGAKRAAIVALAGLAVALAAIKVHDYFVALDAARDNAAHAVAATKAALAAAKRASISAATARAHADSADAASRLASKRASVAQHRADSAVSAYRVAAAAAPALCHPVVRTADRAIAADSTTAASLRQSLAAAQTASHDYLQALDSSQAALSRLAVSSSHLAGATRTLINADHPSFLAKLVPHVSIGPAAIVTPTGQLAVGFGVQLGWRLR